MILRLVELSDQGVHHGVVGGTLGDHQQPVGVGHGLEAVLAVKAAHRLVIAGTGHVHEQ